MTKVDQLEKYVVTSPSITVVKAIEGKVVLFYRGKIMFIPDSLELIQFDIHNSFKEESVIPKKNVSFV